MCSRNTWFSTPLRYRRRRRLQGWRSACIWVLWVFGDSHERSALLSYRHLFLRWVWDHRQHIIWRGRQALARRVQYDSDYSLPNLSNIGLIFFARFYLTLVIRGLGWTCLFGPILTWVVFVIIINVFLGIETYSTVEYRGRHSKSASWDVHTDDEAKLWESGYVVFLSGPATVLWNRNSKWRANPENWSVHACMYWAFTISAYDVIDTDFWILDVSWRIQSVSRLPAMKYVDPLSHSVCCIQRRSVLSKIIRSDQVRRS